MEKPQQVNPHFLIQAKYTYNTFYIFYENRGCPKIKSFVSIWFFLRCAGQCGCRRFYDWVDSQFVCQPQQLGGRGGPDRTRDYGGRRYGGDYGGRRYGGDYEGGRFGDYFGFRPQRTLYKDKIQLAGTLNEDQVNIVIDIDIDIDVMKEEKLQEKFSEWNNRDWTYDEWNAWRKEDGLLCRSDRQHDPEVHSNDLKSNWRSHH